MPPSTGLRARLRAELTAEIKDEARRQLAAEGAPGLSLRAVTRALGMASSAIYRYFPSRDDLLTALIVDAYDAVGAAAEDGRRDCRRDDFWGRWRAAARAVRRWSLDNPHEYALVYGSPVPGYRAPGGHRRPGQPGDARPGPARRRRLAAPASLTRRRPVGLLPAWTPTRRRAVRTLVDLAFPAASAEVAVRAVAAWTQLFGMISFELFGHFHNVVDDVDPVFERTVLEMGRLVGFGPPAATPDGTVAAGGRRGRRRRSPGRRRAGVLPGVTPDPGYRPAPGRRIVRDRWMPIGLCTCITSGPSALGGIPDR